MSTPRAASSGTHAPSEPRRDQLAPPRASTVASAAKRRSRRRAREAQRGAVALQPSQRWRMWNCTRPALAAAQAVQPGAQQRRRLHVLREHAAGGADEGLDAQAAGPGAHGVGPEGVEQGRQRALALRVTRAEAGQRLGVREVQAADAGQQELAAHRRHRVEHVHLRAARSVSAAISPAGPAPTTATDDVMPAAPGSAVPRRRSRRASSRIPLP